MLTRIVDLANAVSLASLNLAMYMKKYCIMLWIDLNDKKSRFPGLFIIQRIAVLQKTTPYLRNGDRWDMGLSLRYFLLLKTVFSLLYTAVT